MNDAFETTFSEMDAAEAFDLQAAVFDDLFSNDVIIQYKRTRVREHVRPFLQPRSRILELNAGTGEDALYFASLGHSVHATDISERMQAELRTKIASAGKSHLITRERCSFNHLDQLIQRGPYDHIFSNFGGLNCTGDLKKVLQACHSLLKPGGMVHVVLMPPFCLWESLLLLKGDFKTATRRWRISGNGVPAKVEGKPFRCWYYRAAAIRSAVKGKLEVVKTEGLCTLVPPSYMNGFDRKHPVLFRRLCKLENIVKATWPWKVIGDYYIMSLRKLTVVKP